ncbi:MAG: 23S rRNA (uracil(1939)-C(5))-methyltransferase RlmD [Eggerthellaceae bacterium]|nr:23S rRNA (uracil(1939)-C(5))-methyltransferase RlmD [Eggerthellaceae bacterium]
MVNQSSNPVCSASRACGACQHVGEPYAEQLRAKDARVAELFSGEAFAKAELRPIIGMDEPFHYRNKVISPFAPGKRGPNGGREILTGMYVAGTHKLVNTDGCLVENEQAQQVVRSIRQLMRKHRIEPYDEDRGAGFLRHVVVRVGHESGEVLVTLVTNADEFPASKAFCRALVKQCPFITTIVQNVNTRQTNVILGQDERRLYGPGFILDTLCGLSFRISSQSFYQVNAVQTTVLYETAIQLAQLGDARSVIDAYCGTGTIGLVAAKRGAAQVTGVDSVESAIRDARENARHNGIENARFVAADATAFMRDMAAAGENADVVLMDPPRAGSTPEFLDACAQLAPKRIVYVSCNPETQVRDLRHLVERGYKTQVVQPVDMFPHTEHVETVVLLSRK